MRQALLAVLVLLPLACHKTQEAPPPPPAPEPTGGQVTFETTPPGAHVTLDGAPLPGVTPFTRFMSAGEGHHRAVLTLDGFEPASSEFMVPLGDYTVRATLAPAPKIQVSSTPPGATVLLDGAVALPATPGQVAVPSGEHTLRFELAGHVPVIRRLKPNERPSRLAVTFSPAALLAVTSTPAGARVVVDGEDTGLVTPVLALPVAAGKPHRVEARAEKLRSPEQRVKPIAAGQTSMISLTLVDLDRAQLEKRRRALQQESARLTAELNRLDKRNQGFITKNAGALKRDENRADAIEERLSAIANELSDLTEQLDAP